MTRKVKAVAALLALAAMTFLAAAGCGGAETGSKPTAAKPPSPAPTKTARQGETTMRTPAKQTPVPRASELPLGVYMPGALSSWSPVAAFGERAGQPVRYVLAYLGPGEPFPEQLGLEAAGHGAEVVLQLEPTMSMAGVAAGEDDGYLTALADEIRDFGYPVIVSWAAEANGNWYSYGAPHTPVAEYRAAWAHVMRVFQDARNITWMATLNRTYEGAAPTRDYVIPGVDMYGVDAYYSYPDDTFATVFVPTIEQIRAVTDKPILINETGIGQANSQVRSIPGLVQGARDYHLAGLIYFNEDQNTDQYHQNWALTPAGLAALRDSLRSHLPKHGAYRNTGLTGGASTGSAPRSGPGPDPGRSPPHPARRGPRTGRSRGGPGRTTPPIRRPCR